MVTLYRAVVTFGHVNCHGENYDPIYVWYVLSMVPYDLVYERLKINF